MCASERFIHDDAPNILQAKVIHSVHVVNYAFQFPDIFSGDFFLSGNYNH